MKQISECRGRMTMSGFSSAACGTSGCDSSTSDTSDSSIDDCNRFQKKRRRSAKVDHSTDERTAWARTGWDGHVTAKLRENSWYDYYRMPLESFNALHQLLFHETQEQKQIARVKALNSTRICEIETEVKLAATHIATHLFIASGLICLPPFIIWGTARTLSAHSASRPTLAHPYLLQMMRLISIIHS
jgi:hypothetical protein